MGYSSNEKKSIVDFCESKTESLSNWVRQVKSKSLNAKTKRKRDLRIIAILSNSLSRAESELISKQRERARRWAQMQADLGLCSKEEEVARQQQKKIDNFWKNDLSGLDSFFRELDNSHCVSRGPASVGRHLGCRWGVVAVLQNGFVTSEAELRQRWRVRVAVNEFMSHLSTALLTWLPSAYHTHCSATFLLYGALKQIGPGCQPTSLSEPCARIYLHQLWPAAATSDEERVRPNPLDVTAFGHVVYASQNRMDI
ncbi:unnamed protein product [Chrysodeixis includens]|uniref:Uncharacterized protein n=1 Tax=Chrysodeixis includens TaxID=689277 RepID=A0A9N8KV06_CHRIL|nr:unnamed protein product [Chrysodeixis includens]